MKKINKNLITLVVSLILCFSVSVGITTAYFTDYETAKGGAELNLSGQTQLEETMNGNDKTVVITNTGKTDMIVRVQIIGDANKLTINEGSGWTSVNGWWYYTKILKGSPDGKSGDSTSAIEAKVSGAEGETDFDIIVVHESSRTVYDGDALVAPKGWDAGAVGQIN